MLCQLSFFIIFLPLSSAYPASQNYTELLIDNIVDQENFPAKCILNIITTYYPCNTVVTVASSYNADSYFYRTINRDTCYTTITRSFYNRDWLIKDELYMIFTEDIAEFISGVHELSKDLLWNPTLRVIVYINNIVNTKEVFNILLKYNIYNAVFVNQENELYTYYPFSKGSCGRSFKDAVKIGNCEDNTNIAQIFAEMPITLRNCTIRVKMCEEIPSIIFPSNKFTHNGKHILGFEQLVLNHFAIIEGINLDTEYLDATKKYGALLKNGTILGIFNNLQNGSTEIVAGGYLLIKQRVAIFDYIWGHNYGSFSLFTAVIPEDDWKIIYREFSTTTWALIALVYFLVILVSAKIQIQSLRSYNDRIYLILELWGYFYGNTSQRLFKNKRMRLILIWWIWFTFVINNLYNTAFYSLITDQSSVSRNIHLDSLNTLPFKPCIADQVRNYFKYAYGKPWPQNPSLNCRTTIEALNAVAENNNLYTIDLINTYLSREYMFLDDEGNHKLEVWDFSGYSTVHAMYMVKGFPLKRRLQIVARQMFEMGLLTAQRKFVELKTYTAVYSRRRKFKNFNISHISVAITLLFFGLGLASICFLIEIYKKRN